MKRVKLLVAIVLAVFIAAFTTKAAAAPMPAGTILTISPGSGSNGATPCSAGSCFGMFNQGGWVWTDFGPGFDGGVVLGADQITGGQEYDGSIADPGEMTSSWFFFNSHGSFGTMPMCAPNTATVGCVTTTSSANTFSMTSCASAVDCLGKTTLGTWHVGWNGVAVPMGSALGCQASPASNCVGVTSWTLNPSPAICNSTYELRYSWAVPDGDPSGFGNVPFALILRGKVSGWAGCCDGDLCINVACNPATDCKSAGVCNPCTGVCEYTNKADGTACTSDNNVSTNDICQGGSCTHVAVINGTSCDADSNKCTGTPNTTFVNDVYTNGVCVPGPLKVCTGTNTCKNYGTCIPSTGNCLPPTNKAIGTPCDDGNPCTLNDICTIGGVCKGTTNLCSDTDPCTQDACTSGTGVCTHTPVGTPGVCGQPCPNPIPAETKLRLTAGQGSGTNVPCSVGSCFSMVNGVDIIWTDILPGTDGGFWVGHPQASGGQENTGGGTVSTSGALTAAWNFFSAEGTFFTTPDGGSLNKFCGTPCLGYDCLNKTELKVFTVAWNGGTIPMGSAAGCVLSNCSIQQNNDVMVNNWSIDPANGGAWSMNYAQVVPVGSFSNVNFQAILRGTVSRLDLRCTGVTCPDTDCTAGYCDTNTGQCVYTNRPNGTACNDGNACTTGDVCVNGNCVGTPLVCVSPDQCHDVSLFCDPLTGCSFPLKQNGTTCNDGNACTVNDVCSNGVCSGTLMNCKDGDACTDDVCSGGTCTHTLNCSLPGCSSDPRCLSNKPMPAGTILTITPGSGSNGATPCSTGSCFSMNNGGILVWTDFGPGTDGGIVLGTDQITGGQEFDGSITDPGAMSNSWKFFNAYGCFGTAPMCAADGTATVGCATSDSTSNFFSMTSCVSAADCVGKTTLGTWHAGWNGVAVPMGSALGCKASPASNCVGVSSWTLTPSPAINGSSYELKYNWAVPAGDPSGFGNVPFGLILRGTITNFFDRCYMKDCNDNNPCTTDLCDPATGECTHPPKCNDGNDCTDDICDPATGNCTHTSVPNGTPCSDNNACTIGDVCLNGSCISGTPKICNDNNPCTTDTCNTVSGACVFTPKNCDDANGCTDDSCDTATGNCIHTNNTAPCSLGNVCTVNYHCSGGVCVPGEQKNCDDNNPCTIDTCNPATGCVHTFKNCNDNNPCTTDSCDPVTGACVNTLISPTCGPGFTMPNGTLLTITQGSGASGTTPCSTGSCFGMFNPFFGWMWTDFGPGTDGGVVLGTDQYTGGQEFDGSITDPGQMTSPWFFFNSNGCFATAPMCAADGTATVGCATSDSTSNFFSMTSCVSAADCVGKTTLGTWHAGWNGVAVPMGSALGCKASPASNCVGVSSWTLTPSPAINGSSYELKYNWAVPAGDPSGFGNVPFALILRGTVTGLLMAVDHCIGITCNPATDCKSAGVCDSTTGICKYTNVPDNTACASDNNVCTNDICQGGTCQHVAVANGTACNADNNLCTGTVNNTPVNDTCTNGVCVAGPLKVCTGTNTCKNYRVCVPSTGNCPTPTNKPVGTPCDDNNACTLNDVCAVGGVCKGTTNFCRDNDVCTLDVCDTGTGACTHSPMGTLVCGQACPDPLPANTKLLIAAGRGSGTNVPCSVGSCFSMETGSDIIWTDIAPGTDGGFWIGHSQASGGQENVGGGEITTSGALTAAWGFFNAYGTFMTMPDGGTKNIFCGTPCQGADCIYKTELKIFNIAWNNNIINMGSEAGCVLSNCTDLQKNGVNVNDWQIDPVSGSWSMDYAQVVPTGSFMNVKFHLILRGPMPVTNPCANAVNGTPCDDGNACTTGDTCQGGVCMPGTPKVCTATDQCHVAGTCDPSTGACSYPSAPDGTRCNDNNPCTFNDVCAGGTCKGIPASCPLGMTCDPNTCSCVGCLGPCVICTSDLQCSSGRCDRLTGTCVDTLSFCKSDACTTSSCDPASGCVNTPVPNGTACNDGNACTVGDTCQAGICTAGTAKVCTALDQCHVAGTCNPASGACSNPIKANGTACNDGAACTTNDVCTNGTCAGTPVVCPIPQVCNTATGICVGGPTCMSTNVGAACNDNNVCTTNDKCVKTTINKKAVYVCQGTTVANGTACTDDGNLCTTDSCQSGVCTHTAKTCNDGNACTTDSCNTATGQCVYTPIVCNDNNECTTDSCDPKSGCKYTPKANGTACTDDGNLCTTDTCQGGKCTHTARDCNDHNICTADSCNPATGTCVHTFNKPTTVTLIGDQPSGETSAQNLQIQTKFTVTNGGCVVSTSGNNKVYFSAGSSVYVNSKVGAGPNPTTIKLDNASQSTAPASSTITCPSATTTHSIYLDNLKATGGKDKDNLFIYGNAQD